MFGYIMPCAPELKVRDEQAYRAFYCGLCRGIGRYGISSRAALTYDGAFMAALLSSLRPLTASGIAFIPPKFEEHGCAIHPMRGKYPFAADSPAMDYSSAVCIMLAEGKLRDDIRDGAPSHRAALPLIMGGYKKAVKKYPDTARGIKEALNEIAEIEKAGTPSLDDAPISFGAMLTKIALGFPGCEDSPALRELMQRIGGFIYLCDAWDDRAADQKAERYNVFNATQSDIECAAALLDMYCNSATLAYDLLDIVSCKSLLDNIVYYGMPAMAYSVLHENGKDKRGRKGADISNESI